MQRVSEVLHALIAALEFGWHVAQEVQTFIFAMQHVTQKSLMNPVPVGSI